MVLADRRGEYIEKCFNDYQSYMCFIKLNGSAMSISINIHDICCNSANMSHHSMVACSYNDVLLYPLTTPSCYTSKINPDRLQRLVRHPGGNLSYSV